MTFSLTTFSITAFSVMTFCITIYKRDTQHIDKFVYLSVTHKPFILSVIMLNVVMLSIIRLNVFMLSVIRLNVVAPFYAAANG